MKLAFKILIILGISLNLCACQWSLEPLPLTSLTVEQTGEQPRGLKEFAYRYTGEKAALFSEIWNAEIERSSLIMDKNAESQLDLTLRTYDYSEDDNLDFVPGVCAPGFIPFGPLGFWWVYDDLSVDTPSLRVELLAVLRENSNNRGEPQQLVVRCEVTRGIAEEDSLARSAFSLASIKVLEWLENNNK